MKYNLIRNGSDAHLTIVLGGELFSVDNSNPFWDQILDGALSNSVDDEYMLGLLDLARSVKDRFETVSERVSVSDNTVYFDGDAVDNSISAAILRAMREGANFASLALFMEKVYQNPNKHSRENLYSWLADRPFTITESGNIIAYKGVSNSLGSIHAGPGIVNGQPMNGTLPNNVGNVIEMARSSVTHDPAQGCSVGLHVGTWEYASGFGSTTLKVEINPRDVVSVPTDCDWQKMRVCRYRVLEIVNTQVESLVDPSEYDDDWATWDE